MPPTASIGTRLWQGLAPFANTWFGLGGLAVAAVAMVLGTQVLIAERQSQESRQLQYAADAAGRSFATELAALHAQTVRIGYVLAHRLSSAGEQATLPSQVAEWFEQARADLPLLGMSLGSPEGEHLHAQQTGVVEGACLRSSVLGMGARGPYLLQLDPVPQVCVPMDLANEQGEVWRLTLLFDGQSLLKTLDAPLPEGHRLAVQRTARAQSGRGRAGADWQIVAETLPGAMPAEAFRAETWGITARLLLALFVGGGLLLALIWRRERQARRLSRELWREQEYAAASEQKLRLSLEAAGQSVWDWDLIADQFEVSGPAAALLLSGSGAARLSLRQLESRLRRHERLPFREALGAYLRQAEGTFSHRVSVSDAQAGVRRLRLRGQVCSRDPVSGQPLRMLGTIVDVTDALQEQELAIWRSEMLDAIARAQTRFIAQPEDPGIIHELLADLLALSVSELGFVAEVVDGAGEAGRLQVIALAAGLGYETAQTFVAAAPPGLSFALRLPLLGAAVCTTEPTLWDAPQGGALPLELPQGHPPLRHLAAIPLPVGAGRACLAVLANRPGGYDTALLDSLEPLLRTLSQLLTQQQQLRLRRAAEAAEQAAEAQTQAIVELMVDGVISINARGLILAANQAARRIFGYEEAELLGRNVALLMPEPDASRHDAYLQRYLEGGAPHIIGIGREVLGRRRDGSVFPMELAVNEIARPDGSRQFTGLVRDISARKAAEARLRLFGRAVDALEDGVFLADATGGALAIVYINQAFARITGYEPAEILGRNCCLLVADDHDQPGMDTLRTAIAEGRGASVQLRTYRKDGRLFWSRMLLDPIQDGDGRVSHYVGAISDITAEVEAEKSLRKAWRVAEQASLAKSRFLSSVSHELRTPLNAVLGYAQLAETDEGFPHSDLQRECLGQIQRSGWHLLALITQILDLSSIESGGISLSIEDVEIAPLLEDCLGMVQHMAQGRGLALDLDVDARLTGQTLRADRTRIKQVLTNLLSNAIKYNRPEGNVWVRALPGNGGQRARIIVTDTGPGLGAEQVRHLFEPFNRLGRETDNTEGTGIGLFITRRLVEEMGGQMGVDSVPGQGSSFWVELPLGEDTAATAAPAAPAALPWLSFEQATRVLYVEDNPASQRLVERFLATQAQIELRIAEHGQAGLELAQAWQPHLVVTDIHLPDMDGFEFLERLRAHEAFRQVPVIAVSANALLQDVRRGLKSGFAEYLVKPFDLAVLLRTIHQARHPHPP